MVNIVGQGTIRPISEADFEAVYEIINDAANAYCGVIPPDRWHDPYMPRDELCGEIASGVVFFGYEDRGNLLGVMGVQDKGEVTLIRHAYVRTQYHSLGIGGMLLDFLLKYSNNPFLIGTWADAIRAIQFYEKHGFHLITNIKLKNALLHRYWSIPERQVETSVVLADDKFKQ